MSEFELELLARLFWFQRMFMALLFLIGLGVGGVTWICVLFAKNSSRFW